MPGTLLEFDSAGLRKTQVEYFGTPAANSQSLSDACQDFDNLSNQIIADLCRYQPAGAVMFSGGVDSTYLQAVCNRQTAHNEASFQPYTVVIDHPRSHIDREYADSAGAAIGRSVSQVRITKSIREYLLESIALTGETPNHIQATYFSELARRMHADGVRLAVSGEAADGVFGLGSASYIQHATRARKLIPIPWVLRLVGLVSGAIGWNRIAYYAELARHLNDFDYMAHPVNRQATYADWDAVIQCFGKPQIAAALQHRREMIQNYGVPRSPLQWLHAANLLTSSMDSGAYWATLMQASGIELQCPFLDSRLIKFAFSLPESVRFVPFAPKKLIKEALCKYLPREVVYRKKLGFGQPVFEWLSKGGQLSPLVEDLDRYSFIDQSLVVAAKSNPNWFLYSLVCLDRWIKEFGVRT